MLNVPGEAIKTEPRDSPTHQFLGFQGTYRNPNESPSPVERSPVAPHGSTTPVGPTSPYTAGGANSLTPTPGSSSGGPGGYQPNVNDFFLGAQPQQQPQFPNQYNYVPSSPANGQPVYQASPQQQQQTQNHQFQIPGAQPFNLNLNLMNGGLPNSLVQPGPSQVPPGGASNPDFNLSSLLDMDLGKEFTMNSSEIKSIMGVFSASDIKQEMQNNNQQQHPRRMQKDEENLSNSFTRLTTGAMNDLDK
ncbi:histone-lysine N-methyltransferase, H3 lysine-79 specific-like [Wyeomyia smithii]|uniref:histone-lysine N-methyltransferase, H3 lysine-79 specific-like n=1 Tax=Wyeomyia smithii TaxID=174621 RepID=UPI002467DB80|nr:histone-lysine N-methyltransferase, H3 lysine-79 specific-like [Wyeomyia smithii]XP_055550429.1 histone-lysine N-methyltransferase, H3 lysine-79 specific-like [Wyeomyia smithii]